MHKGKGLLVSLGIGLLFLSFLDFDMPIHISLGIAVFVTLITLYDFNNTLHITKSDPISSNSNKYVKYLTDTPYYLSILLDGFSRLIYYFSIPISVYVSYKSFNMLTFEELQDKQQSLTLYSLGLVIIILAFDNHKNTEI